MRLRVEGLDQHNKEYLPNKHAGLLFRIQWCRGQASQGLGGRLPSQFSLCPAKVWSLFALALTQR